MQCENLAPSWPNQTTFYSTVLNKEVKVWSNILTFYLANASFTQITHLSPRMPQRQYIKFAVFKGLERFHASPDIYSIHYVLLLTSVAISNTSWMHMKPSKYMNNIEFHFLLDWQLLYKHLVLFIHLRLMTFISKGGKGLKISWFLSICPSIFLMIPWRSLQKFLLLETS